jgi:NitT/TauT family transport system ATP-binding protein
MIELKQIGKTFYKDRNALQAVEDVSLVFKTNTITALIGPSGCGKSTLLNMIAGLYQPTEGSVHWNQKKLEHVNTAVGYMTQKDNLLPWRTVISNVALPLEIIGVSKQARNEEAKKILKLVNLDGFEEKYSNELSGGMRKRACLARMLLHNPEILLLDEPFAALDAQLRVAMHDLLLKLWSERQQTIILVTHDLVEAITLADRVIVFSPRPAKVAYEKTIELERPRDVMQVRFSKEFQNIHNEIWEYLRQQYAEEKI